MDKERNCNISFLSDIYQNTCTGIDAINALMPKVDDDNMKKDLEKQLHELRTVKVEASDQITKLGEQPKDGNTLSKAGMWTGLQLNSLMNQSSNHLAQMMIQGNNMGIISLTRSLNDHAKADQKVKSLASKLLEVEKRSIDTMKNYLHAEDK